MTANNPRRRLDDCGGPTKKGTPCKRPAGWGTEHVGFGHCKLHFGNTESHVAKAQGEQARTAAQLLGKPEATDPFRSLQSLELEAKGYVNYFREKVCALDPDAVFVSPTSILRRPLDMGSKGEDATVIVEEITSGPEELHVFWKEHKKAMEELRKISKTMFDVGLAAQLARMNPEIGAAILAVNRGVLEDLGIEVDSRVREVIRKRLMAQHFDADATSEEV